MGKLSLTFPVCSNTFHQIGPLSQWSEVITCENCTVTFTLTTSSPYAGLIELNQDTWVSAVIPPSFNHRSGIGRLVFRWVSRSIWRLCSEEMSRTMKCKWGQKVVSEILFYV